MTGTLKLTFAEIRENLALVMGLSRTPSQWQTAQANDAIRHMRNGLRDFYSSHRWSFLRSDITIVTSVPYSTGTIAATSGVVTLTGGTWPTWAIYGWLYVDGIAYEVNIRTSDSLITLDDTTVSIAALSTYEIRRFGYAMPTDFAGFDSPLCYAPGESVELREMTKTTHNRIRRFYQSQSWEQTGEPLRYSLYTLEPSQTAGELRAIAVWPPSDAAYHLTAERYVMPNDLDATNLYPAGGAIYGNAILEAILSQAEKAKLGGPGPHQQAYQIELAKAISNDQLIAAPDSLGPIAVDSDGDRCYPHRYSDDIVLYEGHESEILG